MAEQAGTEAAAVEPHHWVRIASTRPVQLRGDDFRTRISRSALDDMVHSIEQSAVWVMVEHLDFLPPLGRQRHARVIEAADGEAELYVRTDVDMPRLLAESAPSILDAINALPSAAAPDLELRILYDRRNFAPGVADAIEEESGGLAFALEQQAELPPIQYVIAIPVVWGAARFLGAFFDELGRAAGQGLSTKIASWTGKSRDPSRTSVLRLDFELPRGAHLAGFVFAAPGEIEPAVDDLLEAAEGLATIAGLQRDSGVLPGMKLAAYFLDKGEWHLGWWTDGASVIVTNWFTENPPDVEGVLGRKPFWDASNPLVGPSVRELLDGGGLSVSGRPESPDVSEADAE